ncbi:MAG: hypothetical protein WDN04_13700 [Rhodospirillales bacterium]
MIELVLVFCLISDGNACIERRPTLDPAAGPMACLTEAQPIAAAYLAEHPKYRLSTWRCKVSNRPERAA